VFAPGRPTSSKSGGWHDTAFAYFVMQMNPTCARAGQEYVIPWMPTQIFSSLFLYAAAQIVSKMEVFPRILKPEPFIKTLLQWTASLPQQGISARPIILLRYRPAYTTRRREDRRLPVSSGGY